MSETARGTLDIVIPHGGERWAICRKFFDMLRVQLCADLSRVRVLLIHDGCEPFPDEWVRVPGLRVEQHRIPKSGVSAARNTGLDFARAEWVMFCDADDLFASCWALHCILDALDGPESDRMDLLWTPFYVEENAGRNVCKFNWIFVHGKLYRRTFLLEEGIRFWEELYYAEDSAFNACVSLAIDPPRIGEIHADHTLYVWTFNRESVTSRPENQIRNQIGLLRRHELLIEEMIRRGHDGEARELAGRALWDGHFLRQRGDLSADDADQVRRMIARICLQYGEEIRRIPMETMAQLREASRAEAEKKFSSGKKAVGDE